jgi:hypothetical protein
MAAIITRTPEIHDSGLSPIYRAHAGTALVASLLWALNPAAEFQLSNQTHFDRLRTRMTMGAQPTIHPVDFGVIFKSKLTTPFMVLSTMANPSFQDL